MPRFTYAGPAGQVFPQYLDTKTGSTLVAEPGETYDIKQVAGLTVPDGKGGLDVLELPMPPNENFKAAARSKQSTEEN